MSSPLAIAAVTAVIKDLLDNALIDQSNGPVAVSAVAPDQVRSLTGDKSQLNLFLYRVAPNTGYNNAQLPSRNSAGERVSSPPLALDLFYLLSAHEKNDFGAEIMLGYAMQVLFENSDIHLLNSFSTFHLNSYDNV